MKIGILTHPLIGNYGGILQALAMKRTIEDIGHDVIVLDRRHNLSILSSTIKAVGKFIGLRRFANPFQQYEKQIKFIYQNFNRTKELHSHEELVRAIKHNNLDLVIIGSDQVWNLSYTKKSGLDYWGEFMRDCPIRSFSYAASMGASDWSLDQSTTERIRKNLREFCGISVREFQTKKLLDEILDIPNIEWVLDPTMLQSKEFYNEYAVSRIIKDDYVFVYWLGDESLIPDISQLYPNHKILKCKLGNPNYNLSVEEWLSAIKYADAIITDSFHGCAISIIYRKHFIPYINKLGGAGRLTSLFKHIGLDCKLNNPQSIEDYDNSEFYIKKAIQSSMNFLNKCLSTGAK